MYYLIRDFDLYESDLTYFFAAAFLAAGLAAAFGAFLAAGLAAALPVGLVAGLPMLPLVFFLPSVAFKTRTGILNGTEVFLDEGSAFRFDDSGIDTPQDPTR
jgi:hypothetical protein